jgi:hypothetical protein
MRNLRAVRPLEERCYVAEVGVTGVTEVAKRVEQLVTCPVGERVPRSRLRAGPAEQPRGIGGVIIQGEHGREALARRASRRCAAVWAGP